MATTGSRMPVELKENAGPDFGLFYSTDNEMMVALRTNVIRIESSGIFPVGEWNTTFVGTGTATHSLGELITAPGATANSSAKVESVLIGRQMSGTTGMWFTVVRLSDLGVPNNKRRWGYYNDSDGFFYELDGQDFYIVTRKAGVDTRVHYRNWNGVLTTWTPGDLMKMSQYGSFFGGMSCRFHINGRVAHSFGANVLSAPLTEFLSLPMRYETINSSGQTVDAKIFSRGTSFHRVSPSEVTARYKHISTATTTLIRSGPGTLRSLVINNPSAAGTITIYDNTVASGNVIAVINIAASSNNAFSLLYDLETTLGITIVTAAATDITVIYD